MVTNYCLGNKRYSEAAKSGPDLPKATLIAISPKNTPEILPTVTLMAVPAAAAESALRANTRNPPSAYLGRNRVPRGGVEENS